MLCTIWVTHREHMGCTVYGNLKLCALCESTLLLAELRHAAQLLSLGAPLP
jgi:hypothetical protein